MDTKSILLAVADPQALVGITQALGHGWETTSVSSEADALAQLEQRSFDALLADFNLGSPDASQLLSQALEKRPETHRFLLACEADLALVAAYVSGPHDILPKPLEPASLKSRIETALARSEADATPVAAAPSPAADAAPAAPAIYAEVLQALEAPGTTNRQVAEILARDPALTSEVLALTRSVCPGLPRDIADPAEAVEALGVETVKALVMALRFLAEHSHLKSGYLSFEKLWQHSVQVARLARDLAHFETRDRALAAEALVAGLLHDLGKVVLAANFDDLYGRVHSLARKQPVPLWEVEKEMFGASHGEIGGCLVGMWNMPASVVQAAAFHHEPPLGEHERLSPLAAVHIANVLEHELRPTDEFRVAPVTSPAFLNELGLLERMPVWRAVFAGPRAVGTAPDARPVETAQPLLIAPVPSATPPSRTANDLPAPAAATRTATLGEQGSQDALLLPPISRARRWAYAGVVAVTLGLLAVWIAPPPEQPVRALAPARIVAAPAPAPEPAPAAVPEDALAMAGSEAALEATAAMFLSPAPVLPEPQPAVAPAPPAPVVKAPPPQAKPQPQFRLNGIIFTIARPAAILNGQTVFVGDWVNGATVVSIERTQVTLQLNGQRKTVALR